MTRTVNALRPTLAALLAAVALAGCGGGGSSGGGDTGGGGSGSGSGSGDKGAAYDAAFDICRGGVKATADAYAVEPTKEAVSDLVVEQVSGGSARDEQSARQGCLDALAQAGR
jgi:hypothetical protein